MLGAKRVVRAGFRTVGLEITRYRPRDAYSYRRRRLLQSERVDVVLDIGANRGSYAAQLLEQGFTGRLISFEPLGTAFAELSRRSAGCAHWDCHRLALGNEDAERKMHVSEDVVSSSFLSLRDSFVDASPGLRNVGEETVPIARLDTVRERLFGDAARLLVKMDVQGFELEVLKGGEDTLRQAVGVECELSLAPIYEHQTLFADVIGFLAERGFHLRALEPAFVHRSGELLQLDGLFTRREDRGSGAPETIDGSHGESVVVVAHEPERTAEGKQAGSGRDHQAGH